MAFFRPLTDEEKVESIQLGTVDSMNLFLKKLADKVSEYQKKYRPYDSYSAKIDFENEMKVKIQNSITTVDKSKVDLSINFNWDKYGEPSRFEYVKKQDVVEDKLLDGIRQPTKTGIRYYFKSKEKGNGLSILVPFNKEDNSKIEGMEKFIDDNYFEKKVEIKKPVNTEKGTADKK